MKKDKKLLMLSMLGVISLVLITVGVTYAFFTYAREGTTENSITTSTITFIYEETDKQGAGISIENAYPVSDEVGKVQTASNEVFNFKVKSETTNAEIPYEVTARMKSDSTLSQEAVRIYLTEVEGENETELLLDNYNNLEQTSISVPEGTVEKVIYTDTVPANSNPYEKNFRLRMWIDEEVDFSSGDMNGKTFALTVNVYANATVVTDSTATLSLVDAILAKYTVIEDEPKLTTTSAANESGLYKSTATNSGNPTYYFRGNVDNTVEFAGQTWNIVRINEDGTIRLIMANGINDNQTYEFNGTNYTTYPYMYYSNSNVTNGAKYILNNWYKTNITNKGYSSYIVTGNYFCEEAKVKYSTSYTSGSATMSLYSSYKPTFECSTDKNNKGIVNGSIGLITYDEVVYAGAYYGKSNSSYYLYNGANFWTMSPAGFNSEYTKAFAWRINPTGTLYNLDVNGTNTLRPVINLKADVAVVESETGTSVWTVVE